MNNGNEILSDLLSAKVLANITDISLGNVIWGQHLRTRASKRIEFPMEAFEDFEQKRGAMSGHRYPCVEVATVISGRLNMMIGHRVYDLRKGDWVVVPPRVPHCEYRPKPPAAYTILYFLFWEKVSLQCLPYDPRTGQGLLGVAHLPQLPRNLRELPLALAQLPWDSLSWARTSLIRLTAWCLEQLASPEQQVRRNEHPVVLKVKKFLSTCHGRTPSVTELARVVRLSPNYLSTLFRQEACQTLREFINTHRIEQACQMLRDRRLSLKSIAYSLNFTSSQHFNHAFRRLTGTSPTAFRKSNLKQIRCRSGRDGFRMMPYAEGR